MSEPITSTSTSPITSTSTDATESTERAVEKTVRTAIDIGRLWAVYGLEVGRAALRTSGETLRATSEILGELSKKIDERREPSPSEEPEAAR